MFEFSYTLRLVMLGTMMLGASAGMLGTFLVLRRQALIGDALSHAALPGIMIAYLFTGVRSLNVLLVGAFLAALTAMAVLELIKRRTRIKFDASMALILSGFFGVGQVLLSHIQQSGVASQAGLSTFIFGQAASMLRADVRVIMLISFVVVVFILFFYKELKLYVFDTPYFNVAMRGERFMSALLNFFLVLVIVIGIRMVGVILMSALLIAPSVASRQISNRLVMVVLLAGVFGAVAGFFGSLASARIDGMPTGPAIAVILGVIVIVLLLFSPRRGVIANQLRLTRYKRLMKRYKPLIHLKEHSADALSPTTLNIYRNEGLIDQTNHLTTRGESLIHRLMGGVRP